MQTVCFETHDNKDVRVDVEVLLVLAIVADKWGRYTRVFVAHENHLHHAKPKGDTWVRGQLLDLHLTTPDWRTISDQTLTRLKAGEEPVWEDGSTKVILRAVLTNEDPVLLFEEASRSYARWRMTPKEEVDSSKSETVDYSSKETAAAVAILGAVGLAFVSVGLFVIVKIVKAAWK